MDKPFFILEMAGNHMGDVSHGIAIIRALRTVTDDFPEFEFGVKLQYRNLDKFIHSSFQSRQDIHYIKRFQDVRLTEAQFDMLLKEIRDNGFKTICTPFDEESVDLMEKQEIEMIKVASCSFMDWPLLERVVQSEKPIIISSGGVQIEDIDRVVSFLQHRKKQFSLMHCVPVYPTPDEGLLLNQIDVFKDRYPNIQIGYSTHERPENTLSTYIVVGKGVTLFEKHVGLPTEQYALNKYSITPDQARAWFEAARNAFTMCGPRERCEPDSVQIDAVTQLKRAVFSARDIPAGHVLTDADVQFAFPQTPGQILAEDWSKYSTITAKKEIKAGTSLMRDELDISNHSKVIYDIVQQVKALLKKCHAVLPGEVDLELSHHYGLDQYDRFGLTMVTIVNRDYCKRLLILLPGQVHPEQHHKIKNETYHILGGSMKLKLDGVEKEYKIGDVINIPAGMRHEFTSDEGVVAEEISSTYYSDDTFYTDQAIMDNPKRKTYVTYWLED